MLEDGIGIVGELRVIDLMPLDRLPPAQKVMNYFALMRLDPKFAEKRLQDYRDGKPTALKLDAVIDIRVGSKQHMDVAAIIEVSNARRNFAGTVIYEYMYVGFFHAGKIDHLEFEITRIDVKYPV